MKNNDMMDLTIGFEWRIFFSFKSFERDEISRGGKRIRNFG